MAGTQRLESALRRLRSPEAGLAGQGIRFALAGVTVAVVYLTATTVLSEVAGLPFQAALAIGFAVALATHFSLQRFFVWSHHGEFALPPGAQVGRYLAVSLVQYGVTAAVTATLPRALDVATTWVYLATTAVLTVANFVIFRTAVFHAESQ